MGLPLSTEGPDTHLFTVSALTLVFGCFSLPDNSSFLLAFFFFFLLVFPPGLKPYQSDFSKNPIKKKHLELMNKASQASLRYCCLTPLDQELWGFWRLVFVDAVLGETDSPLNPKSTALCRMTAWTEKPLWTQR